MPDRRLPGTETKPEQIVCHVDMDCFYAACERLREPRLRGEPLVVGMGYEAGETVGAVATASYEAREHGIESAMAISEALEILPGREGDEQGGPSAFYRPVDMAFYESVSDSVQSVLAESADVMRAVSIDEAYLDVTDRTEWASAEGFARELKAAVDREAGVVASVGVAPTMSAAKIASDADKPDGLVVVEPGEVASFLAPMDVEAVHNVGPVTARTLRSMGIETAGDLAAADPDRLAERFGERGREIYRFARGEDDRQVTPKGDPKSLSRESAFDGAVEEFGRVRERARGLATAVADRATRQGALYQTIGVKVVTPPYEIHTRARSLSGPVDDPDLVVAIAEELLDEFADDRVRKVGVRVSNLSFTDRRQVSLDGFGGGDTDGDRQQRSPRQTTLREFR